VAIRYISYIGDSSPLCTLYCSQIFVIAIYNLFFAVRQVLYTTEIECRNSRSDPNDCSVVIEM
jgi:hypothetical protein